VLSPIAGGEAENRPMNPCRSGDAAIAPPKRFISSVFPAPGKGGTDRTTERVPKATLEQPPDTEYILAFAKRKGTITVPVKYL
jgi:hypothetical protein